MKNTLSAFIKNTGHIDSKLIRAVVSQLGGWEQFQTSAPDITNHGIDGGFSGFIYYSDTHIFAVKNRKTIVELLEEQADQLGEDVINMVSGFGVFRNGGIDKEEKKNLYKYLGGCKVEQDSITNVMAWFAGEEVSRAYCDFLEELK